MTPDDETPEELEPDGVRIALLVVVVCAIIVAVCLCTGCSITDAPPDGNSSDQDSAPTSSPTPTVEADGPIGSVAQDIATEQSTEQHSTQDASKGQAGTHLSTGAHAAVTLTSQAQTTVSEHDLGSGWRTFGTALTGQAFLLAGGLLGILGGFLLMAWHGEPPASQPLANTIGYYLGLLIVAMSIVSGLYAGYALLS